MNSPHSSRCGVALVIVLAFVVLLTGLIVAFFARSMTSRQLSNSSAGQTKAAVLAQSASDIVIAGFRKEIVAGSASPAPTYGTNPNASNLYLPTPPPSGPTSMYMVPVRYPTAPLIPNLVRESKSGDNTGAMPAPGQPSYASAVNSTSNPALGGRSITAARWNSHFLIPSQSTATTANSAPDPAVSFVAPDWVIVTRNGPAVETASAMGSGSGTLNDPTSTNGNFVIGRYTYAVYDEGDLLDMNVAGHPTAATTAATTGFTPTQVSRKGPLALADLTQLPLVKSPASASDYLAQSNIDSIVGWRNYASAGLSGASYPTFTFSPAQSTNWFTNFVSSNQTGFMTVYGGDSGTTGATDQAFLSRQQLLKLQVSIGFGANVLQYMGTFSRSLEQPSFIPAHIQYPDSSTSPAPSINAVASTAPPSTPVTGPAVDSYLGNNDAAGTTGSTSGQDLINPSLLSVRVTQTFTRSDLNKTPAVIGEPLLKTKFPLSRLAEVTFSATDSTGSVVDPTLTGSNHIKAWFGLSRSNPSLPWTYYHGATHVMTLTEVAAAGRDADFAELLKAAINVGSLAKGGPNLHNNQSNYQYTLDTTVDYQVLQIMANLIDQYDTDSYPTVIQIAVGSLYRTFRGVEDLPYFYRYHPFAVVTRLPSPLLSQSNTVQWSNAGTTTSFKTSTYCEPAPSGGLTDGGNGVMLYVPEVWNPHDAYTPRGTVGARPGKYRLTVVTDDPLGQTPVWQTGMKPQVDGDWYGLIPPTSSIPEPMMSLADGTTSFTFGDNGGRLFREPTLLWRADAPNNINLQPDTNSLCGPYTDVNTKINYFGVQIGQGPISYVGNVSHTTYTGNPQAADDNYLFQASFAQPLATLPTGAYQQYTFRLQYQDPNNSLNWITYDEKYPDIHGLYQSTLIVNKSDPKFANNAWEDPLPNRTNQMSDSATGYDPRTGRFGIGTVNSLDHDNTAAAPEIAAYYYTNSNSANDAINSSKFTIFVTERPVAGKGNQVNYSNPGMTSDPGKNLQMRLFSGVGWSASNGADGTALEYDGVLFGQNNPAITLPSRNSSATAYLYYEDPDGVARRAMGAYSDTSLASTDSTIGQPLASANTYGSTSLGVGTPTAQSQSRPLILNRPFSSVGEMSYAFRGTPWKQLDFFTPESGDAALLDVFCLNELPTNGIVAGKVNLNTKQTPVLQAIIAGGYRDEQTAYNSPVGYALGALNSTEAINVASKLLNITNDSTNAWRGPFTNVSNLVGRFIGNPGSVGTATDQYTFAEPVSGRSYTYAGLSAALDSSVYTAAGASGYKIQRMREAAIRPLADAGQTRVWNLMIDVVAQSGRYSPNATTLAAFSVDGECRYWVHVAIDRYTGEVLDKQIEAVSE